MQFLLFTDSGETGSYCMETMFSCFPSDDVGPLRLNPQWFMDFLTAANWVWLQVNREHKSMFYKSLPARTWILYVEANNTPPPDSMKKVRKKSWICPLIQTHTWS